MVEFIFDHIRVDVDTLELKGKRSLTRSSAATVSPKDTLKFANVL